MGIANTVMGIFLLVAATAVGQNPSIGVSEHFRWSSRNAQELDSSRMINKATDLDAPTKNALITAISEQLRPFMADLEISSERELRHIATSTRIKLIDLNRDGSAEVIAQATNTKAGCGATGNCPFWVFEKTSTGYKPILDSRGGEEFGGVQVFTINPVHTNGFNDLILGTHDSASEKTLYVFRYRDGRYRPDECYEANWVSTAGDKWHILKNPVITHCVSEPK